jgi:thymidylate synthase (FAD)
MSTDVIDVLDHGFVRLVDSMGDDASVVRAARVSYDAGTKTPEEDARLIRYLMRNQHTSPFEQVVLVFHIKLPLFVFAQLARHRTARLNAQSARYTTMTNDFYLPGPDQMRGQGTGNKQVGDGILTEEVSRKAASEMRWISHRAYNTYLELLEMGVCREQARMVLPQNLYTQCFWQMDLHNLLRFIELRDHPHAQHEIRVYAQALLQIADGIAPVSVAAWRERVRPGG